MKIYTKTGDNGTTGLFAGPRVSKDDPRIQAYGSVDELNAVLGVALAEVTSSWADRDSHPLCLPEVILEIQGDLFSIGAELATPNPEQHGMCLLKSQQIDRLESWIDEAEEKLEPLKNFILPGGSRASATLHHARTVCRRAEREVVSFMTHAAENSLGGDTERLIVYLNRLSDLLFVLARFENDRLGIQDLAWHSPK